MLRFSIMNKEGKALTMGELDNIVANFWNVKIDDNLYASPDKFHPVSWFDTVGQAIACLPTGKQRWCEVIGKICSACSIYSTNTRNLLRYFRYHAPYLDLCYHFQSLGLTPYSLKDN